VSERHPPIHVHSMKNLLLISSESSVVIRISLGIHGPAWWNRAAIRENLLGETPFVAVVGHVPFFLGWQPLQADGKQWSHRGIDVLEAVPFTTPRAAPWGALAVSFVVHLTCFGIGASIVISPKPAATNLTGIIQADIDPVVAVAEPVLLRWWRREATSSPPDDAG
jgi:hypothetical protein